MRLGSSYRNPCLKLKPNPDLVKESLFKKDQCNWRSTIALGEEDSCLGESAQIIGSAHISKGRQK
jgi:hypothetical protein